MVDDQMIVPPAPEEEVEIIRGTNIASLPQLGPLPEELEGLLLLILGDNVTTDDISPAGAQILSLRANVSAISRYVFSRINPGFADWAQADGVGFIIGGINYGQGSSREHAALAPRYLGIRVVITNSYARIHRDNLINFGILPLEFKHEEDIARFSQGDRLRIRNITSLVGESRIVQLENMTRGFVVDTSLNLSHRLREVLLEGGLLAYTREKARTT